MEGKVIQQPRILEFGNMEETIMKKGFLEIKITNKQLKLWFFSPRDRWGDPTRKLQLSTPSFQFLLTITFSFSELMGGVLVQPEHFLIWVK